MSELNEALTAVVAVQAAICVRADAGMNTEEYNDLDVNNNGTLVIDLDDDDEDNCLKYLALTKKTIRGTRTSFFVISKYFNDFKIEFSTIRTFEFLSF